MLPIHMHARLKNLLHNQPSFALLGDERLEWLGQQFDLVSFTMGDAIVCEGENDDHGYLIHTGKARVYRRGENGQTISLGMFTPGDFFGAHANPGHWMRTVSCRAAEDTVVFRFSRQSFESLLHECPALFPYFDKALEQAALLRFLRLTNLLGALPAQVVMPVVAELVECTFKAGEAIVREGESGDQLYVIRSGAAQVHKRIGDRDLTLPELEEGDYFGERALLLNEVRAATVVATRDTTCFSLNRTSLERLANTLPLFNAHLARRFPFYVQSWERARNTEEIVLVPVRQPGSELLQIGPVGPSSLGLATLLKLLRLTAILDGLPPQQILALINELREHGFKAGETILRQGDANDRMYILRSGMAKVIRGRHGQERVVSHLGAGQSFGERSLLGGEPAASVVAIQSAECFSLARDRLDALVQNAPELRDRILRLAEQDPLHTELVLQPAGIPDSLSEPDSLGSRQATNPAPHLGKPSRQGGRRPRGDRPAFSWLAQEGESDCGAACLAMIARYHGARPDMRWLRELACIGREGANLANLGQAAEALGFAWRAVKTDIGHLLDFPLPAVAHWNEHHYVVLYRVQTRNVVVGDPAVGLIKMSRPVFERGWTGRLLVLTPDPRTGNANTLPE